MKIKHFAFTLAEVLITLGIIGIVAAITMPSLIQNYRNTVLHNQFKKGYSNLSKALALTKEELGTSDLINNYATYDSKKQDYPYRQDFLNAFYKAINVKTKAKNYKICNFSKTVCWSDYWDTGTPVPVYILEDGSSVSAYINSGTIMLDTDINGPSKGPNRYGFDIFTFAVKSNDTLGPIKMSKLYSDEELEKTEWPVIAGQPCSKQSNQRSNGFGCSYYALNDISPDDNTKTYWKNLPW